MFDKYGFNSNINPSSGQSINSFGSLLNPGGNAINTDRFLGSGFGINNNQQNQNFGFGQGPNNNINGNPLSFGDKAGIGLQAGSALLNGYLGFKQYGLAKDQLNFQKDSFNKNYQNQVASYNDQLETRFLDTQSATRGRGNNGETLQEYLARKAIK